MRASGRSSDGWSADGSASDGSAGGRKTTVRNAQNRNTVASAIPTTFAATLSLSGSSRPRTWRETSRQPTWIPAASTLTRTKRTDSRASGPRGRARQVHHRLPAKATAIAAAPDSTWREHYEAGEAARRAGDWGTWRYALVRVREQIGYHPSIVLNLARADARLTSAGGRIVLKRGGVGGASLGAADQG